LTASEKIGEGRTNAAFSTGYNVGTPLRNLRMVL